MNSIIKRNNGNGHQVSGSEMPFGGWVDGVLKNTLNDWFDDSFFKMGTFGGSQVPVNIRETGTSFELEVVAPGLKKEDFSVNVHKNMLTVSFEHREENKEENQNQGYVRREYRQQSFSRSFTLDDTVDSEKINGRYADGVLYLSIPKKEEAQKVSKKIEIA